MPMKIIVAHALNIGYLRGWKSPLLPLPLAPTDPDGKEGIDCARIARAGNWIRLLGDQGD